MKNEKGSSRKNCPNCGFSGGPKLTTKGSVLTEYVLWASFLIPGMIYSFWRQVSRKWACPICLAPRLAPDQNLGDDERIK